MAATYPLTAPTLTLVPAMTEREARACVARIRAHLDGARAELLRLYEAEGWRALGRTRPPLATWQADVGCVLVAWVLVLAWVGRALRGAGCWARGGGGRPAQRG